MGSNAEEKILGLPRRSRITDGGSGALLGGITVGILTGSWAGALAGGVVGNAIANQPQPLEAAVREYFANKSLQVIFFQRAPRAVKVTFRDGASSYWTIQSVMPNELGLSPQDTDDWLYGNLIKNELPKLARRVRALKAK